MTRAQAVTLLAELVGDDPTYGAALEVLRPKARKVAAGRPSPLAARVAREYRRPESWVPSDSVTVARYLDTFGDRDSDVRRAQADRLAELQNGPREAGYGCPPRPAFDAETSERNAALNARAAWKASPAGVRFEADRATFEARRAQFAYTGPKKSAKDDERATFALAVLGATGGIVEPEPLPLEVAA